MPVFAYKGFTSAGRAVTGTRDADNERAIKQLLRRDGVFVTELKESGARKKSKERRSFEVAFLAERVGARDLATATRQLATLIGAGIPLVESLVALVDQTDHPYFKSVWSDIKQRVNEGASIADSLANYPKVFTGLYINMVRAGESSGALDVVLGRLADFTESQAELRSKVAGTLFYPIIMMVMAGVVTGVLFMFVIPKIKMIFDAQKVALPLPTEVLIGISGFARDFWFVVLPLLILCIWAWIRFINSKRGRPWWDETLLKMPVFGPLVRMIAVTRFAKTLATLLSSGVPVLTAFDIVKNVVENRTLMKVIEDARDAVKEGDAIAAPFQRSGEFPAIMTHMIAVGEKTGQLEEMLNNVARAYEVQVEARLRAMTTILEPVMIIFMGVIVAFIVLSIILPMLELSSFT
ncbi:MAG: type II secretion system protein GspF [Deltaproteobacteria bacterium RIFOXYA12_FULL_58_15]|nr:MAG: type II secretion system protein GspF [Deltaproteobacteria bacterium RIFOXYA12_FULL_58_15]OGR07715.1 MAG: type II secretion system protein GspF [Deltaproteobacteria bacterium RIFOXYB12_FULL_58_9]